MVKGILSKIFLHWIKGFWIWSYLSSTSPTTLIPSYGTLWWIIVKSFACMALIYLTLNCIELYCIYRQKKMFYIVLHCAVIKRQVNHVQFSLFFTGNSSVPNICAWNTIPFFSFCNAFHFTYQHQMTMMMMMCMKISGGSDNQSSPILVGYEGKHDHCLLLDLQYQTITIPWYTNTMPYQYHAIPYYTIIYQQFHTIPYQTRS